MRSRNGVGRIAVVVLLAAATACGVSESPDDELACLQIILDDYERATLDAAEEVEAVAERQPADEAAQREAKTDLTATARRLKNAGGGCV